MKPVQNMTHTHAHAILLNDNNFTGMCSISILYTIVMCTRRTSCHHHTCILCDKSLVHWELRIFAIKCVCCIWCMSCTVEYKFHIESQSYGPKLVRFFFANTHTHICSLQINMEISIRKFCLCFSSLLLVDLNLFPPFQSVIKLCIGQMNGYYLIAEKN